MEDIKVRAAIANQPGAPLSVETVTLRDPAPYEVLVENRAAGICHTDLSASQGALGLPFPFVPGHEGVGIVRAVGSAVTLVSEGDHVIVGLMAECGQCRACRSGRTNACVTTSTLMAQPIFLRDGEPLRSMAFGASFASHTLAPETALAVIPDDVPFDVAALVGCGVATGVGAVRNTARVEPGSSVVVFGLGSIGLNVVQAAVLAGASRIIAIDRMPHRRELGSTFGATEVLDPITLGDGLVDYLRTSTEGGVDFAFECVGNASVLRDAVLCTNRLWGVAVAVGAVPFSDTISVPGGSFLSGRSLLGTNIGNIKPRTELPLLVEQYRSGTLNLDDLVTAHVTLDDITSGFRLVEEGSGIRTVVVHD